MALAFEVNINGSGTTINGTPYYLAMFNQFGTNVGDTNIKRNIGSGIDEILFQSPNRLNTPFSIRSANTLNDSTFSGQFQFGTFTFDSGSSGYGSRLFLHTSNKGEITIEVDYSTAIPVIDLFDYVNTKHGYIKNNNGISITGCEVGIGGAAVANTALNVVGQTIINLPDLSQPNNRFYINDNNVGADVFQVGRNNGKPLINFGDANGDYASPCYFELDVDAGTQSFIAPNGIKANQAINPYANNAAAVAAIGTGKLYYTDVAGEYIVKLSH